MRGRGKDSQFETWEGRCDEEERWISFSGEWGLVLGFNCLVRSEDTKTLTWGRWKMRYEDHQYAAIWILLKELSLGTWERSKPSQTKELNSRVSFHHPFRFELKTALSECELKSKFAWELEITLKDWDKAHLSALEEKSKTVE